MRPLVSEFVCAWLGKRELLSSPFVRYSMAEVLHVFASIDEHTQRRERRGGGFHLMVPQLMGLLSSGAADGVQEPLPSMK